MNASFFSESARTKARTVYHIDGIDLDITDFASSVGVDENGGLFKMDPQTSVAADVIAKELAGNSYQFAAMDFAPGDIVLDLGAHVGMVSIYLARKFPFIDIRAFEPSPENFSNFVTNLTANNVANVQAFNQAVTGDGRDLNMIAYYECNSGGATAQLQNMTLPHRVNFQTASTTLDAIFKDQEINRCKLLKIDVEGSEYEILLNSTCLDRVEYLVGEFHMNDFLSAKGYSIEKLYEHVNRFIPAANIRFMPLRMAE